MFLLTLYIIVPTVLNYSELAVRFQRFPSVACSVILYYMYEINFFSSENRCKFMHIPRAVSL